jgi:endonuclease-3
MLTPAATRQIIALLDQAYPQARCSLDFRNPYELLVATVLSAQCTDERVNLTTPALFARYPDPAALAQADLAELEAFIRPTGFYHNKARNLLAAARMLVDRFQGQVPARLEDLILLPGAARKTANVVLGAAFGQPAVVVDTHVKRLAQRLGWTTQTNPDKIERDLQAAWPRERWTRLGHQLIAHGRAVCQDRRPRCGRCLLEPHCLFEAKEMD